LSLLAGVRGAAGSTAASASCGARDGSSSNLPHVEILGGPPPPSRQLDWVARICTALYPGPHCATPVDWNGTVSLCIDGELVENVKMATRGHVSKLFPKQQYKLKLSAPRSLLGMAESRHWILAMSYVDTSFQRNRLAFELYRALGGWAPRAEYLTLSWHGVDFGLYYICEKIERSPGRVHLPEASPERPESSGYIVKVDWPQPGQAFAKTANTTTDFVIVYPKTKRLTGEQFGFVQRVVNEVDARAALIGNDSRLEDVLDFRSFARYFIVQELSKDLDGYAFSNFMAIDHGRLHHIAPWDYDLAFGFVCMPQYYRNMYTGELSDGVVGWNVENPRDSAAWIGPDGWPGGSTIDFGMNRRSLFAHIWRHEGFRIEFAKMWREARRGPLSDDELRRGVARRSRFIEAAAEHDLRIWQRTQRCAVFDCCDRAAARSFQASVTNLVDYVVDRAHWIDVHVDDPPNGLR